MHGQAESEAWAVATGKDGEAGLREGTGKITCIKVPLKRGKRRTAANFERRFIPY